MRTYYSLTTRQQTDIAVKKNLAFETLVFFTFYKSWACKIVEFCKTPLQRIKQASVTS